MWYCPRHVAYAVVDDTLFDVDRVIMIGDAGALTAAALVDGYVHDHRAALHLSQMLAANEFGRGRAGNQHRGDD